MGRHAVIPAPRADSPPDGASMPVSRFTSRLAAPLGPIRRGGATHEANDTSWWRRCRQTPCAIRRLENSVVHGAGSPSAPAACRSSRPATRRCARRPPGPDDQQQPDPELPVLRRGSGEDVVHQREQDGADQPAASPARRRSPAPAARRRSGGNRRRRATRIRRLREQRTAMPA